MWNWDKSILKQSELDPIPSVLITNYAFAHRVNDNLVTFQREFNTTELEYWTKTRPKDKKLPRYMIFQNVKDVQGIYFLPYV